MDPLVLDNIGFVLVLSELKPASRNCLIQHATDVQIDLISSIVVNLVFKNVKIDPKYEDNLSEYGPLLLMLPDKSKGRQVKKSTLLRYPRFITILFQAVRADIINQMKNM
jgi:hypothetical protein